MCGIVGKIYSARERSVPAALIEQMAAAVAHRGPDGQGVYCEGPVAFGHRRLAIIDLHSGAQPMATPDGRLVITFNGEIYNFREMRRELEAKGFIFRTTSDTEVILHAYTAWGEASLERFNGMFAFALWDWRTSTLLLARDRLGIKPLYYHHGTDGLVFASELRAILQDPTIPRTIDPKGLSDYLSLGYVVAPTTLFQGIAKLPPAHFLRWKAGQISIHQYWDLATILRAGTGDAALSTVSTQTEVLQAHLQRAVSGQLVSDVPVGAFLSGGLDSSAVVATMSRVVADKVRTFSIGFDERTFNELPYAQIVARWLQTDHSDLVVRPSIATLLPRIAQLTGEPLGDSSLVPTYCVSQLARQGVKVVLSGDGGDELFAGYETYAADRLYRYYRYVPAWVRHYGVAPLVRALPAQFDKLSFDYKAKQFIRADGMAFDEAHYSWRQLFSESEKAMLVQGDVCRAINGYRTFDRFTEHLQDVQGIDPLQQMQYVDVKTWLADDILVKVDRASMAHGLEARVPLLDHELVEFALRLPARAKLRRWQKKYLLKKAVEGKLPREVIHRKKAGFNAPVGPWLRGELHDVFSDVMFGNHAVGELLNKARLRALFAEHCEGRCDHGYRLWSLLMLGLWSDGLRAGTA